MIAPSLGGAGRDCQKKEAARQEDCQNTRESLHSIERHEKDYHPTPTLLTYRLNMACASGTGSAIRR